MGQALLSAAASLDARYIVMGAYGHGSLRAAVLGGVTRQMVQELPVPLLLGRQERVMKRTIAAGALYFLLIFLLGMVLGLIRVLLIEPRLGAVASVLLELPFMLAASWFVCGWLIHRLPVPAAMSSRAAMGALAFALLMAAELALSLFAVGGTVGEHFANYGRAAPMIGLLGQLTFAVFPLVRYRRRVDPR